MQWLGEIYILNVLWHAGYLDWTGVSGDPLPSFTKLVSVFNCAELRSISSRCLHRRARLFLLRGGGLNGYSG